MNALQSSAGPRGEEFLDWLRSGEPVGPRVFRDAIAPFAGKVTRAVASLDGICPGPEPCRGYVTPFRKVQLVLEGAIRIESYPMGNGSFGPEEILPGEAIYKVAGSWEQRVDVERLLLTVIGGAGWLGFYRSRFLAETPTAPGDFAYFFAQAPADSPCSLMFDVCDALARNSQPQRILQAMTNALLQAAVVFLEEAESRSFSRADSTWNLLMGHLETHACEPIDRERVARELGLSGDYITHLIRERTGSGFLRLIGTLRLRTACRLLREGRPSIKEVAGACGFASAAHFVRVFRKSMGVTPGQYAAQHRTAHFE